MFDKPTSLWDVENLKEGVELKRANGQITVIKLGELCFGEISDLDINIKQKGVIDPRHKYYVIYDKPPGADGRLIVKKICAYTIRVKVKSPE